MQTQQQFMIESVESGMKLVRKKKNIAIFGGRETLFFDSKRFGEFIYDKQVLSFTYLLITQTLTKAKV